MSSDLGTLRIYEPLPHQQASLDEPHRFKLRRWGRRRGKSREALYALIMGHGPMGPDGEPIWKGMRHCVRDGKPYRGKYLWLGPDYPQVETIWKEEIQPRFENILGCRVVEDPFPTLEMPGGATLHLRTAKNIRSVRGAEFDGIMVDEAAFLDLEDIWFSVLRATLINREGWAYICSTTNFGPDGNKQRPEGPSYFNILCKQHLAGDLDEDEWGHSHGTARENPLVTPDEMRKLYADYENKPIEQAQELEAKLLEGAAGVAFPEWREKIHQKRITLKELPMDAWWGAGLDWGYSSPGWLGIGAFWQGLHGPRQHLFREIEFQYKDPYRAGYDCGKAIMDLPVPSYIAADLSMWDTGDGRGGTRVSAAEEFQRGLDDATSPSTSPKLIPAPKGPTSRTVRKLAMHAVLRWGERSGEGSPEDWTERPTPESLPAWLEPQLSVDPSCKHFTVCMESLPRDPLEPEKAATDGYDHPYDGWTYLLVTRKPSTDPPPKPKPENRHPGDQKFAKKEPQPTRRFSRWGRDR
jgi:hypothetical protein